MVQNVSDNRNSLNKRLLIGKKKFLVFAFGFALFLVQGCAGQSQLISDKVETVSTEVLSYYLYLPEDYKESSRVPLLLFLHGGGESGGNLEDLKTNGPPKMLAEGREFPFAILAPQNPNKRKWWNTLAVMKLLEKIVKDYKIDTNRIYLTGLSRGGGAAWELCVQYPDKFAAMAVVCGMAPLPYAAWINKDMPIWVFHGTEDKSIPFSESEDMVARLREMKYNVTFTKYEGVGHDSWIQAYNTEELYEWFMNQKKK
ncbi:prolyl oligopeptidase family serine peptidase [Eudoraea chungangensis]|uniref:carboxylesterase family protein n=1 Tax=Eudoraea chungangensis TaxID=1481905 RepID=UPI0023EACD54|nr:PHB depolymerase family esterase [Eudoraea chungangensis]